MIFSALSTAESLWQKARKMKSEKKFTSYDKVDYSGKSLAELKNQIATQLHLVRASMMVFKTEQKGEKWTWPSNYSEKQFTNDLLKYNHTF